MKIRDKLTIQFSSIFAFILMVFCMTTYLLSVKYFKNEFDQRIDERALIIAHLFKQYGNDDHKFHLNLRKENFHALPDENIWIFDRNYNLLFIQNTENFKITKNLLSQIKEKKDIHFEKDQRQYKGIYTSNDREQIILVSGIDRFGISKIIFLKEVLISLYLIMLFCIAWIGRFFANEALRPISGIINQVKEIGVNSLDSRVISTDEKDEISELSDSFNKMLSRLEESFRLQKLFVSNVSHELRTPLTSLMGEIELTMMKDRPVEEYKLVMESLNERLKELSNLSNEMIKLVQLNFDNSKVALYPLRIDEVLWQSITTIKKRSPKRNIHIDIKLVDENTSEIPLNIMGNTELLLIVFNNIIDNALKFSSEDTPVDIELIVKKEEGIILEIKDYGIGMSEIDMKHVFQPFYRSNEVRNIHGYGIGLSIVEQIMDLHKANIRVSSIINTGTTFLLTFPIKKN